MREFITRLCWNEEGWKIPSEWILKLEAPPSHYSQYGYGHESWLFNDRTCFNGYQYGFLQGINKTNMVKPGEEIIVHLYTITPDKGKLRRHVGTINNLQKLSHKESVRIANKYHQNNIFNQMINEVEHICGVPDPIKQWQDEPWNLVNCRFKPEDVNFITPDKFYDSDHPIQELNRYQLYDFSTIKGSSSPKLPEGSSERKIIEDGKMYDNHREQVEYTISRRHDEIQNILLDHLKEKYPDTPVLLERRNVDVSIEYGNKRIFIEVKNERNAKQGIRLAIGQLLEYAFYNFDNHSFDTEFYIAGPKPLLEEDEKYLDQLSNDYNLRFRYIYVDYDNGVHGI